MTKFQIIALFFSVLANFTVYGGSEELLVDGSQDGLRKILQKIKNWFGVKPALGKSEQQKQLQTFTDSLEKALNSTDKCFWDLKLKLFESIVKNHNVRIAHVNKVIKNGKTHIVLKSRGWKSRGWFRVNLAELHCSGEELDDLIQKLDDVEGLVTGKGRGVGLQHKGISKLYFKRRKKDSFIMIYKQTSSRTGIRPKERVEISAVLDVKKVLEELARNSGECKTQQWTPRIPEKTKIGVLNCEEPLVFYELKPDPFMWEIKCPDDEASRARVAGVVKFLYFFDRETQILVRPKELPRNQTAQKTFFGKLFG